MRVCLGMAAALLFAVPSLAAEKGHPPSSPATFRAMAIEIAAAQGTLKDPASATGKLARDLEAGVRRIVGHHGSVDVDPQRGLLSVTAPGYIDSRVESYVAEGNKRLEQEVVVSVRVLSFLPKNRRTLAKAATYLSGVAGSDRNPDQIVAALAEMGHVSEQAQSSVSVPSGQPAPLDIVHTREYVKSATPVPGASPLLIKDQVSTGTSMNFIPKLQDGGHVTLSFSLREAFLAGEDAGFDVADDHGIPVQVPKIAMWNFTQMASLRDGATIALYGYQTDADGYLVKNPSDGSGAYVALLTVAPVRAAIQSHVDAARAASAG